MQTRWILLAVVGLFAMVRGESYSVEAMLDDDDNLSAGLDSDSAESALLMADSSESMMIASSNGLTVSAPSASAADKDTTGMVDEHMMDPTMMEHEDDRKKKNKGLQDIYMAFMMVKSVISSMMMFLSPVMQMKSFGLSVINTLINVAKFVVQLRNSQQAQQTVPSLWLDDRLRRAEVPPVKRYVQAAPSDLSAWAGPSAWGHATVNLPPTTYAPHRRNRHPYKFYKPKEPWPPGSTAISIASTSDVSSSSMPSSADRWGSVQTFQPQRTQFDETSNYIKRSSE